MVGSFVRLVAAAGIAIALAGCASSPSPRYPDAERSSADTHLQCVPYVRTHSNITLFGDAYTWWDQAQGRFARTSAPEEGAVMVLYNYAGPNRAHVAVVRQVVNAREIRVDHANWLDDGNIYTNNPVRDVSQANDWSVVRVFNIRDNVWGTRNYLVQGFIGPGPDRGPLTVAQTPPANGQARPGDAIAALLAAQSAAATPGRPLPDAADDLADSDETQ